MPEPEPERSSSSLAPSSGNDARSGIVSRIFPSPCSKFSSSAYRTHPLAKFRRAASARHDDAPPPPSPSPRASPPGANKPRAENVGPATWRANSIGVNPHPTASVAPSASGATRARLAFHIPGFQCSWSSAPARHMYA